ncbi:hypothetical protein C8N36_1408 [Pelagimonas varians]|uniref:Uncharacterized protein n=1 Tax=Pelagimonas varians TaxID=696760 RepID=A0A238L6B1_9RHOB|nr:hypothetical protein C8N36_1408 [Pelagimonas varians]SMX50634.1 hypothetical protein PEV8663_04738 [Pelagimonas varians]
MFILFLSVVETFYGNVLGGRHKSQDQPNSRLATATIIKLVALVVLVISVFEPVRIAIFKNEKFGLVLSE